MARAGAATSLLARVVMALASLVFLIILLAVLLLLLGANRNNVVERDVTGTARWLVGPFDGLFTVSSHTLSTAVNWGLAAFVYLIAGGLIAALLRRASGR